MQGIMKLILSLGDTYS